MLSFILACACTSSKDPADDSGNGNTVVVLPDLMEGLDETGCEDYQGTPIPGAASYFYGFYEPSGTGFVGEERFILFANDAWGDLDGEDCEVVWEITGTEVPVGSCDACSMGISVEATINDGLTSCDKGLVKKDETWAASYDVDLAGDGSATFYFAGSGNLLGYGHHLNGAMNYLSEKSCRWF